MAQIDAQEIVKKLVELTSLLKAPPSTDYAGRLHYKAARSRRAMEFRDQSLLDMGSPWPGTDSDPGISALAEYPVPIPLNYLAQTSVARALRELDSQLQSKIDMAISDEIFSEQMGTLAYLCFAEHINMTLRSRPIEVYDEKVIGKRKVEDLRDLRLLTWQSSAGFGHNVVGDYMKELLSHVPFIEKIIEDDAGHGDSFRSMCILFIADFMTGDPYTAERQKDFFFRPSFEILEKWSRTLWERKGKGNVSETKKIIEFCGKAATAVYCPKDTTTIPSTYKVTTKLYQNITEKDQGDDSYLEEIREALKQLIEDDLNTWKSIYKGLSSAWSTAAYPLWKDAVKKGLKKDDGAILRQWVTDGYFWENELPYGSKKMLRRSVAPNGAYIAAGSTVTLNNGSTRRVEALRKGDLVLTSASRGQSKKISREVFPMELMTGLIGFNGEQPFATPAQIFHTTTGLRAVNPHASMMQNPWAKVGRLTVGHVMYRHKEQPSAHGEYELVEVKSIERTAPEKRLVFGLGLDQGVRNHHVNRYLSTLNHPEVSVEDVSALLGKFSAANQMRLLSSAKELQPILSTFDTQTIWDRLQLEMLAAKKSASEYSLDSASAVSYSSAGARCRISATDSILHLVRSYDLTAVDKPEKSTARLPQVKLLDGNLLLDGEAQSRAVMNDKKRTVSWTRKIVGTEMYEHGRMEIFLDGEAGCGSILRSPESDPRSLEQGRVIRFTAVATGLVPSNDAGKQGSFFSRIFSGSTPVTGTLGLRADWDMTIDKKEWKKGEVREKPLDPAPLGRIVTGTMRLPHGINIFSATIPVLDEILEAINKGRESSGKKLLKRLYSCHMSKVKVKDSEGEEQLVDRRYIRVNEASTLLLLSDQGPEATSIFDLTFKKNLGISTPLPILFQSMYFDRSTFGDEVVGGVFALDPTKRESKGSRYFINGNYRKKTGADADDTEHRLKISKLFASIATPGVAMSDDSKLQPAGITSLLSSAAPPSLERLYKMPYNGNDVNSMQQTLINEAMFYHMKEDDLKNFTNRSRPDTDVLGPELTTQLSEELKKWLQDVYAPAFVTRSLMQSESFKKKFKDGDSEKVWYWWAGNGKKCLSNSKEYNMLNKLAAARAMKKLHPSELKMDIGTSREIAANLYTAVSQEVKMNQILEEEDRGDQINKIVAILYTLHPEEDYPNKWFKAITEYAIANSVDLPFLKDENGKYVQSYIEESMRQLIEKVLTNDPSITGPVRDQLEKDLAEFMEKNNISKQETLEKKVSACVSLMSAFTVEVAKLLAITGNGLARVFGGSKLFLLAGKLAEKAGNVVSKIPLGTKLARGLGALCVVGYFVGQVLPLISVIKGWDKLTPAQRVIGVVEPLRAVLNAADKAFQEYKAWRSPETPESVKAQDSAVLDGQLRESITEPKGNGLFELGEKLNPEGGVKGTMAERLKEGGLASQDEHIAGDSEIWNQEKSQTPENLMPNEKEAASKLSTTSKWIRGLNIVLGFAVGAAMTYSLVEEWDKLSDVGKVINTLSVIVQILAVIVDVIDFGITIGLIASSALSVAIPIVGAVLALIGIGLMIASLFVDMYAEKPTHSVVDDFIKDVATDLIKDWTAPPETKLTYSADKKGSSSEQGTVTITGENKTSEQVSVAYTQMSVRTGDGEKCIFSDKSFALSRDNGSNKGGTLTVSPVKLLDPTLAPTLLQEKPSKFWVYNLSLKGKRDDGNQMGNIIIKKGENFSAAWAGKLKSSGIIEVVENFTNGDKAHKILTIDI